MASALNIIDKIINATESTQQTYPETKIDDSDEKGTAEFSSNFKNYLAIETVGGAYFHPTKNEIVFVYNASGVYQVYSCSVKPNQEATWPQRRTYSVDRCTNPKYLSDDTIVYVSDTGGNEHFQICLIDQNNITHTLSKDVNAKHRVSLTTKKYLYFSANLNDKSKFDIYRQKLPLLQNKPEMICASLSGIIGVHTVSAMDENIAIVGHYISNAHTELILLDMTQNMAQTMLTAQYNNAESKQTFYWKAIRFIDSSNQYLLCVTNYKCDFVRPIAIDIHTCEIIYFEQIEQTTKWNYEYFEFDYNDKYTYFTTNENGYSVLYKCVFEINKSNGVLTELRDMKLPFKCVLSAGDQRSYTQAMSINSKHNLLAFTMSNSHIPTNMFVIDLLSLNCSQISQVSTPGININNFVDCTWHAFPSFDGLTISYFRYRPINTDLAKQNKLFPTIVIIHGGPESQYRPSFKTLVQFYTAAGFMIIAPNVRGSRGYGRTFMDADNIEKRLDSVKDIYELTQYLKANDENIDMGRLVVYGGSYGGFMVLSSITEYPNIFICAVDIVGISNFVTFLQNTAAWRRPLRESEYGSLNDDMETLIKISPIHKIENIKCPLFIIQGDNDERVPLSESIQIYEKLKDKKLNTVLLRFDDEGHGVTKLKNKVVAYGKVLEWLINIVKFSEK